MLADLIASGHCWRWKQEMQGRGTTVEERGKGRVKGSSPLAECKALNRSFACHKLTKDPPASFFSRQGERHGRQIWQEGIGEGRKGNEGDEGGHVEERQFRQEGHEPQA